MTSSAGSSHPANDNRDATGGSEDGAAPGSNSYSSPPCYMHEVDASGCGLVDPQQARDVARWRKAERVRLIAARLALPRAERVAHARGVARDLETIVTSIDARCVSLYWPFRGEPDLHPWMERAWARGQRTALPVVVAKHKPLEFREWQPGMPLARGIWNIPYPAQGAVVVPDVVVAPLVGFDRAGFRLGYGGGYFDRTLLSSPAIAVGVGHPIAEISTIFPQPHDIPMDWIVVGDGIPRHFVRTREAR